LTTTDTANAAAPTPVAANDAPALAQGEKDLFVPTYAFPRLEIVSGKVSLALLEELMATAAIVGRH